MPDFQYIAIAIRVESAGILFTLLPIRAVLETCAFMCGRVRVRGWGVFFIYGHFITIYRIISPYTPFPGVRFPQFQKVVFISRFQQ
jgi:hypothetical protein